MSHWFFLCLKMSDRQLLTMWRMGVPHLIWSWCSLHINRHFKNSVTTITSTVCLTSICIRRALRSRRRKSRDAHTSAQSGQRTSKERDSASGYFGDSRSQKSGDHYAIFTRRYGAAAVLHLSGGWKLCSHHLKQQFSKVILLRCCLHSLQKNSDSDSNTTVLKHIWRASIPFFWGETAKFLE